ncbi:hypothetical protein C8J55DRAFT_506187 [Lentinula edodes]|uniref:Secreted protein n=1 Tax=Lentinula lateritia TaxID=40482 RepID=A0A9W9AUC9_9AGAR|nr:hypothetical protein C8J55DRAFT_506187 [Lentinula edodes]
MQSDFLTQFAVGCGLVVAVSCSARAYATGEVSGGTLLFCWFCCPGPRRPLQPLPLGSNQINKETSQSSETPDRSLTQRSPTENREMV